MKFKTGDKVRRISIHRGVWWTEKCEEKGFKPDDVFTVKCHTDDTADDILLMEIDGFFEPHWFTLVNSPASMEEEYQRALKLVGKKIVVKSSKNKYVVDKVLLRRDNDQIGLSIDSMRYLNEHGWVVAVVFCRDRNFPVDQVEEAPTEKIVKLNDNHNAVVTKGETSGMVIIGGLSMPITKIQEILDAYNKL